MKKKELIERIIVEATKHLAKIDPLNPKSEVEVDAVFGRAVKEIMGKDVNAGVWGEYKNAAKGTFLNREKKEREGILVDYKDEEKKRGAEKAVGARGDEAVLEAEANEEELFEIRSHYKSIRK